MTSGAAGGRDQTVDVLRGYFLLSMASGHVATGVATDLLHVWRWVDGATGFVCLSAFVLGLVQRGWTERGQGLAAPAWVLRRAAQIWLVSLGLTLLALSLRLLQPELVFIPDALRDLSPAVALEMALLLLHVPYFALLSMYVVFLAFAFPALLALRRDFDAAVLAVSFAVYAATQIATEPGDMADGAFVLGAWQFLFFASLVVGWRWRDVVLPALRPWTAWIQALCGLALVGFLWLAHGYKVEALSFGQHPGDLTAWFHKYELAPPVLVYFVALIGVLPGLIALGRRLPYGETVLAVVALLGRHSLAGYVILCVVHAASWLVAVPDSPHGGKSALWLPVYVALLLAYCAWSERFAGKQPKAALA